MPQDQFLNLLATILGAVGAVYVLKAILRLTPKLTERLSELPPILWTDKRGKEGAFRPAPFGALLNVERPE